MTSSQPSSGLSPDDERALAQLHGAIDALLALVAPVASGARTAAQQLEVVRRVEVEQRRLGAVDHALLNGLVASGEARVRCLPDTATLLVRELHISPGQARARLRAAADLGPRVGRDGAVLPPLFESVAAAESTGAISAQHAAVIRRTYDGLSDEVQAAQGDVLQRELVAKAVEVHPGELATAATRLAASLDPDSIPTDAYYERTRDAGLVQRADGMWALHGVLTPECGAMWQTVLDSLGAPAPAADGAPDQRTPGQRAHDVLREVPPLLMRAASLPDTGGVVATLIVTMTADQVSSGAGYATGSHGELIPMRRVLEYASESQAVSVLFDPNGGVMSYGRARRLAPAAMRLALFGRDGGCTFPDCDRPPQWCQAHHFDEWDRDDGETSIANLGLVCGFHHREFRRSGWRGIMIDGVPHWVPPASVDSAQTPRRNTRHRHASDAA